ncbi:MAG TPA: T9SS type A sorting domain-containing protein, partial [Saprospiraceae bacterium]|nr:T9SS type A sorting domain-containing protein [Saprospiraceae bacterium]
SAAAYEVLAPWWANLANPHHLYIGHGAYRLDPSSTTIYSNAEIPNQIKYNRTNTRIQGSLFFRSQNLTLNQKGVGDSLRLNLYNYPALRPPMPWLDNTPPEAPTQLKLTYEQNNISLNWTRSDQASDGDYARQYAIYRFETGTIEDISDHKNLIFITNGDDANYTDDANLDPTKGYTYIVTSLDRLHNESLASCKAAIESRLTSLTAEYISKITIYPNPSSDRVYIDFSKLEHLPQTIEILNAQGQILKNIIVNSTNMSFDIGDLSEGIYFIGINNLVRFRLVKN